MRKWILSLALVLGAAPASAAELLDRVIAVVNKDVVLWSELAETLEVAESTELRGLTGEAREKRRQELETEMLDVLVGQELIDQAMDRANLDVEDREVDAAIDDVARQNGLTIERLYEELGKQGMAEPEYRLELRKQLRQYKFMNMTIRSRVEVDETAVRNRFNQTVQDGGTEAVWKLQRIMLSIPVGASDEDKARLSDEAAGIVESVQAGKDFAAIAASRSDDASTRDLGGAAGDFKPSELSPSFRDALAAIDVGEVARIDTPGAIFLLRVAEKLDATEAEYERLRDEIYRQLYDEGMQREMELWTLEERRRAHVQILL